MHICVCVFICIYACIFLCVSFQIRVCCVRCTVIGGSTRVNTCVCVCVCTDVDVRLRVYVCDCIVYQCACWYLFVWLCICVCLFVCVRVCVCVDLWSENAACGWNLAQGRVWLGPYSIFNILSQHLKIRIFHIKIQLSSFS